MRHRHHHHRHHRRGPRHRRHRAPRAFWQRLRSVHRRVLVLVAVAIVLGAGVGVIIGLGHTTAGIVAALLLALVGLPMLSWFGTWRILGPVRRLAQVADRIGRGHLDARDDLDASDDEVGPVADALHGMADRVSRQLDDQRALMGAVSHELRSPLARARVLVEMSREGSAPADVSDLLEQEIEAMDRIVGDLLAAARIDFDATHRVKVDVGELASTCLAAAGIPADRLELSRAPHAAHGDPTLLGRALGVMVDNAVCHGGGVASVRVGHADDAVYIKIFDDGPGFSDGDQDKAFQPFWRAGGESAPRGEGLGLALVRRIAEAHGGTASAGNRQEGGAWVRMALPVAPDEA